MRRVDLPGVLGAGAVPGQSTDRARDGVGRIEGFGAGAERDEAEGLEGSAVHTKETKGADAMIEKILNRLFRHEEINGANRCPTYLHRWTLFQPRRPRALWRGFGVYVHKFVGDDWSRDLHDHPKRFISIGISGSYVEQTFRGSAHECPCDRFDEHTIETTYRAPWLRTFPAEHRHRLRLIDARPCWTLVIVLRSVREWGFWHRGVFHHWRAYVAPGNAIANSRKACP